MDTREKVQLTRPFKNSAGEKQSYVNMDRLLTVGVIRRAQKLANNQPFEYNFHVVRQLVGLEAEELERICDHDYDRLVGMIQSGEPDLVAGDDELPKA